jgi:hypothetical protein
MANDNDGEGLCVLIIVGLFALWIYGGIYIFMGWKLFAQIRELYHENEYAKAIIDWIFIIFGFIFFGRILRYFFGSKPK